MDVALRYAVVPVLDANLRHGYGYNGVCHNQNLSPQRNGRNQILKSGDAVIGRSGDLKPGHRNPC
ncbi:MAG: hypothetical protein DMG65_26230 [Candidatus Angelobacter sp. Gp1-AA117]|nr:MAG: hypothetical protein DMG65_26230 [Candidatus Angelobacter sp. Gp1-AA117]